jgi:hypothetical protein
MLKNTFFALGSCLLFLPLIFLWPEQTTPAVQTYSDGPYLFFEDEQLIARWMEENTLVEVPVNSPEDINIDKGFAPSFDPAFVKMDGAFNVNEQIHFDGVKKLAAISDVHGQYDVTVKLLREHGIIDGNNDWSYGDGHLVMVGDVFDRGDQVTEILWLLHKLEQQAPRQGGHVHYLLGNHEIMVLNGDLRYIHKKYRYTTAVLKMTYDSIFHKDSYLGRWLRTKPVAISINNIAFTHAGFSQFLLSQTQSFEEMNTQFREKLIDTDINKAMKDTLLYTLYSEQGPVWYRGYFEEEGVSKEEVKKILNGIGQEHIIVGHTSHEAITCLYGKRVIGVDSSIKFGKSGEILIVEEGKFYRGTIFGEKVKLK